MDILFDETGKLATTLVSKYAGAAEPMLAYFNYFQCQTLQDAGSMMGLDRMLNIMILTVSTYLNFSRCLAVKDTEPIAGYYVL